MQGRMLLLQLLLLPWLLRGAWGWRCQACIPADAHACPFNCSEGAGVLPMRLHGERAGWKGAAQRCTNIADQVLR